MRRANSSRVTRALTVRTSIVAAGAGASSTPTPGTNCAASPATPAQIATIVADHLEQARRRLALLAGGAAAAERVGARDERGAHGGDQERQPRPRAAVVDALRPARREQPARVGDAAARRLALLAGARAHRGVVALGSEDRLAASLRRPASASGVGSGVGVSSAAGATIASWSTATGSCAIAAGAARSAAPATSARTARRTIRARPPAGPAAAARAARRPRSAACAAGEGGRCRGERRLDDLCASARSHSSFDHWSSRPRTSAAPTPWSARARPRPRRSPSRRPPTPATPARRLDQRRRGEHPAAVAAPDQRAQVVVECGARVAVEVRLGPLSPVSSWRQMTSGGAARGAPARGSAPCRPAAAPPHRRASVELGADDGDAGGVEPVCRSSSSFFSRSIRSWANTSSQIATTSWGSSR